MEVMGRIFSRAVRLNRLVSLRTAIIGGSFFALSAAVVGVTVPSTTVSSVTTSSSSTPVMNQAAPIGDSIQAYAASHLSGIYGGIVATQNATHIDVYLTTLDSQTESHMLASLGIPASDVTFILTPTTIMQQDALHKTVIADSQAIRASGVDLVGWGPVTQTGEEQLRVVNPTASQIASLQQKFGPHIEIVNVSASSEPITTDRQNDSAPWNGGDFISNGSSDCTSGIPVNNPNNTYYIITASHCFSLNQSIYNESATIPLGTGNYMGVVSNVAGGTGGLDAELVNMSSSNLLYTGPTATLGTSRSAISGSESTPTGYQICDDGAFEGEYCSATVVLTNQCQYFDNGVYDFCGLSESTSSNSQFVGQGDSGGPVFLFSGTSLLVTGTITGEGGGTSATCGNWYPQTTRSCNSTMWFTDISQELSLWGLTVN